MKFIWSVVFVLLAASSASAQIDPATVHVVNSPNVLTWPITTQIQRLDVTDQGVRVTFDQCASWPDVTPPGWQGPLKFTLWLFENIGGEWYGSGIIQFWACDQFSGGAIYQDNQIARNWVYDNRWSAMVGHQPAIGERLAFMVSAGNARGQDDHLVAARSPIVEFPMPSAASTYPPFLWVEGAATPPIIVVPPVVTPPVVTPPVIDWSIVSDQIRALSLKLDDLARTESDAHASINQNVTDGRTENRSFFSAVAAHWKTITAIAGPFVTYATCRVTGKCS